MRYNRHSNAIVPVENRLNTFRDQGEDKIIPVGRNVEILQSSAGLGTATYTEQFIIYSTLQVTIAS